MASINRKQFAVVERQPRLGISAVSAAGQSYEKPPVTHQAYQGANGPAEAYARHKSPTSTMTSFGSTMYSTQNNLPSQPTTHFETFPVGTHTGQEQINIKVRGDTMVLGPIPSDDESKPSTPVGLGQLYHITTSNTNGGDRMNRATPNFLNGRPDIRDPLKFGDPLGTTGATFPGRSRIGVNVAAAAARAQRSHVRFTDRPGNEARTGHGNDGRYSPSIQQVLSEARATQSIDTQHVRGGSPSPKPGSPAALSSLASAPEKPPSPLRSPLQSLPLQSPVAHVETAEERMKVHDEVLLELKYFGIAVPPRDFTDETGPLSATDIEVSISKALAPARGSCDESCQTPDWETMNKDTYEEAHPESDVNKMTATELALSLMVDELRATVRKITEERNAMKEQSQKDREMCIKCEKKTKMYAEENRRVLELLDEQDANDLDIFSLDKVGKTALLSSAEQEELEARMAEEVAARAAEEAAEAVAMAAKEREEAEAAAEAARKEQAEAAEAELAAGKEVQQAEEAEQALLEGQTRLAEALRNTADLEDPTVAALEKEVAELQVVAERERQEAEEAKEKAAKERAEANEAAETAKREMEEALAAAKTSEAATKNASEKEKKAAKERAEADAARLRLQQFEADEAGEEDEPKKRRMRGELTEQTLAARLGLRRAATKIAREMPFVDKMSGQSRVLAPKSLKWARQILAELGAAKLVADNAQLVKLRGTRTATDKSPPGTMFLPKTKPKWQEVVFWRPPEYHGLARLPEFLYEYMQTKFGEGRTAERRLGELMATIATHSRNAPDITLLMRFVSEQWEVSTLSVYLNAVQRLTHIRNENPAMRPDKGRDPEAVGLFEGFIPTATGVVLAKECIGVETWPESRQVEFARSIGDAVGGSAEVSVPLFLEALCCEHAMCERTFRVRLEGILEEVSARKGYCTYNEYLAMGRKGGVVLQGHTTPEIKAANELWAQCAMCANGNTRVYRHVPHELIVAGLQMDSSVLSSRLRLELSTPASAVATRRETGLRPVGDAAIMSHVRSRWMAASKGLDEALSHCDCDPHGGDTKEEVELLRMRFLAVIGSTFGSAAYAAELYARLLYTATHAVLETGKSKKFTISSEDILSGDCSKMMRAAEDMASLVLTQHQSTHDPAPNPTFTFGADNTFKNGVDKSGGVLFKAKGPERVRRREVQECREKTLTFLSSGVVASTMAKDIEESQA